MSLSPPVHSPAMSVVPSRRPSHSALTLAAPDASDTLGALAAPASAAAAAAAGSSSPLPQHRTPRSKSPRPSPRPAHRSRHSLNDDLVVSAALAESITASLAAAAEMQTHAAAGGSTHRRTASVVAGGDSNYAHSGGSALSIVPQQARSWRDVLQKASSLRTTDDLALLSHYCRMHDPPLFPSVSDSALFNLSAYLCMTSYRRGQILYHEGERLAFVFMLLAPGTVALSQSENGVLADQAVREQQSQRSRPGSSAASPHLAPPTPSSGSHSPMSPLRMKLNKIRGGSRGGSSMSGRVVSAPVADDLTPSRLLALVQPGILFGARFSSSIAGLVPPPLTAEVAHAGGSDSQQTERHYRHTIVSSHTATAKRNLHVLCLSLDIFLKFFPDSVVASETAEAEQPQQQEPQEFQLTQQPAVHVAEEKEERSAVAHSASSLRGKPASSPLLHPSSAAASRPRAPIDSDDFAQLSRAELELPNSTVSPRPRERILAHAVSDVSIGVLPHKGERAACAAAAHSQSAASLPACEVAPAENAVSGSPASPNVPGLHLKPLQLHGSESEPTIKILPSAAAADASSAAASRPISAIPSAVTAAAARPTNSSSASPQSHPMNLPSPMLRQLKARGEKMWHVLQDAVGLQVHLHKQAKAAGTAKPTPIAAAASTSSGAPSARALEIEAELASVPENEDITEIPLDEDEETQLKRRLKFLRSVSLGGIAHWSQEKLLKFAMGMEDRRYAGRAVIYRQSDPSTHVFFIHTGCIQLQRTLSESQHYLDLYTDHLGSAADEKQAAKSYAKTPMDVTTGAGVLRKISFEAVAALHPNPGQDDLRTTVRPAGAKHGGSYTLLREMDFVSGKLSRSSSDQFFAVQFLHTSHSLRLTLHAHRGSADLFVCNTTLLPSSSKHTWMGSTNLSAKENAQWASMMGSQGMQGRHKPNNSSGGGGGGHHSSGSISTISPGTPAELDTNGGGSMPGSPMHDPHGSMSTALLNVPSAASSSSSGSTPARSCEILISRLHPAFRNGWFYLCVSSKGSSCDYSLRLAAVPLESNSWKVGSAKKAQAPLGLASLGRYSVFGLEGVLNSAARDEEAVSLGQTLLYAMPREDFLSAFGPGHGFSAAVSQSATLASGPSYSLSSSSSSTSSSSSHSSNPALALQDLIRQTSSIRLHRAHLHQSTLQVQQVLQTPGSSDQALRTTLDHYAKVEARQTMVEQSLQRAEERKAAKAKALRAGQVMAASAAVEAAGGAPESKKPLLTADTQKLRINHAYRRRPVPSAGRSNGDDEEDDAANARENGGFSFEATSSQKLPTRAAAARNHAAAAATIAGLGPDDTHQPQIVQATGTTGPSQRRHRAGAEEATKKHVLGDEVRMLAGFLAEEAHGHRPPEKPAELHHALLARQLQGEHDALIARSKIDHGVDPTKRIALDMHALHRRDVTVVAEEVAAVAESASLDDILQNRVAVALPPPERLLATEKGVHALALARAPAFKLAEAPPAPKPGLRIKHSDTFNTTALLMTAQLGRRGLEEIMAEARTDFVMSGGADGTSDPAAALEKLAAAFEPEVQPSSLLAIESGEWVPEQMPQATPRPAGSPSRRGQKAAQLAKSASQPALDLQLKRKKGAAPSVPNLRATRTSLAIYATDDPAVEALKDFNRSIPATYAREQEFAHAFRATGKEKRVRDTELRPAARPSHPLAGAQRLQSIADAAPLALNKAWPLLESPNSSMARSHSTPMLLMPGTDRRHPLPSSGKDDSSIFDLTSVDAQEPEPESCSSESPSAPNGGATVESGAATPKSSAGGASSSRRSALVDSLASDSVPQGPTKHVYLPSAAAPMDDEAKAVARLSHRSFADSDGALSTEGTLVPFSGPSDAPSFTASLAESPSKSLITIAGGIAFSPLPLDGLGAGSELADDLPSIGVGYQFAPNDLKPLKPRPFPGSMPGAQRIQELAREMGHIIEGGGIGRVSRALVNQESLEFARERHAAQHHSAPFLDHSTHSAAFRSKQREMMPWAAKEARVAYLASLAEAQEAAAAAQEQKEYETPRHHDLARAATALGIREEQPDSEEWDADEAAASSPSAAPANRPAQRAASASRMRPSASVGTLPHASVARTVHKKPLPVLELTGVVAPVYPHPMSPGSHAAISPASPPLGSSQSLSNLAGSNSTVNSTRLSRPSSSKHGHPARVGPAHMSLSSSDVPAMAWLHDRMRVAAEAEAEAEGSHAPRSPSSLHLDAQAIIRPIAAPLSGFRPRGSSASGARSGSGDEESNRSAAGTGSSQQQKKKKKKYFKGQLKEADRAAARVESAGSSRSNGADTTAPSASAEEDANASVADSSAPVDADSTSHPSQPRRRSLSPASLARIVSEASTASRRGSLTEAQVLRLEQAKQRRLTDEAKTKEILDSMRSNQEVTAAPANDGGHSSSRSAVAARHAVDFAGLPPVPRHMGARPSVLLASSPTTAAEGSAGDTLRPDSSSSSPVISATRTHHRAFSTSSAKAALASLSALTPPLARTPSMTGSPQDSSPLVATPAAAEALTLESAGSAASAAAAISARAAKPETGADTVSPVEEEVAAPSVAAINAILAAHPLDRPTSFLAPNRLRPLPVPVVKAPDVYVRPKMQLFVNHPLHRF